MNDQTSPIKTVPLLINGKLVESKTATLIPVTNPANQEVIANVPCATDGEVEQAISSAKVAFETWRNTSVGDRARLMLRYQHLLKEHHDELGGNCSSRNRQKSRRCKRRRLARNRSGRTRV